MFARMNLSLDKNEVESRSLDVSETDVAAEKALREAVGTGRVGALTVDPQYLSIHLLHGTNCVLSFEKLF